MVTYKGKIEITSHFSDDMQRRYFLKRKYLSNRGTLKMNEGKLCFILINPSYADELLFDKSNMIASNIGIKEGYNEVIILNMYSLITKDKKSLIKKLDIASDALNDQTIIKECKSADKIILAWGTDDLFKERKNKIVSLLKKQGMKNKLYSIEYISKKKKVYNPAHLSRYLSDNPYNFKIKPYTFE